MECGEQREGLGWAKRAIGLLFLAWLAANLKSHPCRRLRIAQKPRPPASVQAQRSVRDRCDDAGGRPAKGAVAVLRGRVSIAVSGVERRREATMPWRERAPACAARSTQHALSLARASLLPPQMDCLYVTATPAWAL